MQIESFYPNGTHGVCLLIYVLDIKTKTEQTKNAYFNEENVNYNKWADGENNIKIIKKKNKRKMTKKKN